MNFKFRGRLIRYKANVRPVSPADGRERIARIPDFPTATPGPTPTPTMMPEPMFVCISGSGDNLANGTYQLSGTGFYYKNSGEQYTCFYNDSLSAWRINDNFDEPIFGNEIDSFYVPLTGWFTLPGYGIRSPGPTVVYEACPVPSVTPSATLTQTPAASVTPSPTPTASETPTPTVTGTATPTPSPTPSITPSPTVTGTPEPTATETPTPSPTPSITPTSSATPSPTVTGTPEPTPTPTDIEGPTGWPRVIVLNVEEEAEFATGSSGVLSIAANTASDGDIFYFKSNESGGGSPSPFDTNVALNSTTFGIVSWPSNLTDASIGYRRAGVGTLLDGPEATGTMTNAGTVNFVISV